MKTKFSSFFGLLLVLAMLVSACAQAPAAPTTAPTPTTAPAAAPTTTAGASGPPLDVNIVVHTAFLDTGNSGSFEASGPAVKAGLICPKGIATDIINTQESGDTTAANFLVHKQFVCDDNSGTFTLKMEMRVVFFTEDNGAWNVFSGTGAYEKLHGEGMDHGDFVFDNSGNVTGVTDNISGKMQ